MTLTDAVASGSRFSAYLAIACLLLGLGACSEIVKPVSQQPPLWASTHAELAALDDWRISARMAMQGPTQGGSVDLFWTQQSGRFLIRMVAPLGQGAVQLRGDSAHVEAQFADGNKVSGDPEQLLYQHFEVAVPVAALAWWLRGIAFDADYRSAQWDDQGRLYRLAQLGWNVEMRDYREFDGVIMPTRFYLESQQDADTNLRFIVRNWSLRRE